MQTLRPIHVLPLFLASIALGGFPPFAQSSGRPTRTIYLERLWQVGDEGEPVGVVRDIAKAPDGSVLMLDQQFKEVRVYSPEGEFVRSLGTIGEGPAEYQKPRNLTVFPDGTVAISQYLPGKIVRLSLAGQAESNYPLPSLETKFRTYIGKIRNVPVGLAIAAISFARHPGGGSSGDFSIVRLSAEGTETARYYHHAYTRPSGPSKRIEGEHAVPNWTVGPDGYLFVAAKYHKYEVDVFSPDGKLHHVSTRAYDPYLRSREVLQAREKANEELYGGKNWIGGGAISWETSKSDQAIFQVFAREAGGCWVLSSRGARDQSAGQLFTVDSFDSSGRFDGEIQIFGEGSFEQDDYYVIGDKMYVAGNRVGASNGYAGREPEDDALEDAVPAVYCYEMVERSFGN